MVRKTGIFFALWAVLIVLVVTPSWAQKSFSLNHTMGVNTYPDQAAKWFATQMEQRTKGAIKVKVFSAGELGQEVEQYDALNLGTLEPP